MHEVSLLCEGGSHSWVLWDNTLTSGWGPRSCCHLGCVRGGATELVGMLWLPPWALGLTAGVRPPQGE